MMNAKRWLVLAAALLAGSSATLAFAQQPKPPAPAPAPAAKGDTSDDDHPRAPGDDAMMVVTTGAAPVSPTTAGPELFPLASQLWVHYLDLTQSDQDAVERALGDPTGWLCGKAAGACFAEARLGPGQGHNDGALVGIRLALPYAASAITVWSPIEGLHYNPRLVGHGASQLNTTRWKPSKRLVALRAPTAAAPPPVPVLARVRAQNPMQCPMPERPNEGELEVVLRWPTPAEVGDFQYVAIADECNNAIVTRFARELSLPVEVEMSDSCNMNALSEGPLKVLRAGTTYRVTAFNLDRPSRGNVVSTTYRVNIPGLETTSAGARAPVLFTDFARDDLRVECGPNMPQAPPKIDPRDPCPPKPVRPGHEIASQSFVIRPEALRSGRCRVVLHSPSAGELTTAPLLLHVSVERVDLPAETAGRQLVDARWIISGDGSEFVLPQLTSLDGEARLRLTVSSDPADPTGSAILFSDAVRGVRAWQGSDAAGFRRDIATASITTAPLCGDWDFRRMDEVGSCLRAYVTVPVMLATFQITRAPWVEKPIADPSVPGGIGVALAIDSYNPAKQQAFPLALQFGGAFQRLTSSKNGILTYVGINPSLPVLGSGNTTTTIGLLLGGGVTYIMDSAGPNEGFKPAAFAAIVVGTGQFVLPTSGGPPGASH